MNRPDRSILALTARFLKRFSRKENGVISIEAVMIYPLLFWGMCASYSFFDGYKQSSRNLKASYAIADVLSRERNTVTATYIDTLYDLVQEMISDRSDVSMRISFLRFDLPDDRHYVQWSCIRGDSFEKWNDGTIGDIREKLPVMPDNGKMILVEVKDLYRRPFSLGYGDSEFAMDNFVFTHPRVYDNINAEDNC
ncbi:MAG: TadE/TadG family type IV pilus assembly protein [Ruegeria sp.]